MGTGNSQPQFSASTYVLDYSVNLLHPDRYGQIMQRNGPNLAAMPEQGRAQVINDMNACLTSGDPLLIQRYARSRQYQMLAFALFFLGPIVLMIAVISSESGAAVPFMIIAFIAGFIILCRVGTQMRALGEQWRTGVVSKLREKLGVWGTMYPALTFSIIYPVEIWRRSRNGRRLVAVWCYVRVTQGPCVQGHNEPIFATTTQQMVQQPQQMVVVQQPQQVQAQTMMVQGAQGQPMMVQGVPQVINGQQVIVVQQPPQQQAMVQQQMQPQYGQPVQMVMQQQMQQQQQQPVVIQPQPVVMQQQAGGDDYEAPPLYDETFQDDDGPGAQTGGYQ